MTDKTSLGDRIKKYETASKQVLPQRMPVILRVDGKAFHTYTKGLKKVPGMPCDANLEEVMNITAIKLCEEIQGAQMAYVQSDEISILIHGYKKLTSQGWFDNKLMKMVSVSAAIASATFTMESWRIWSPLPKKVPAHPTPEFYCQQMLGLKPAYFDSRAFVLPESDVCNYFIWRQQDATRNSVQMLARSLYSHKECNNKNGSQLQEMTFQKGRNWNDEPTSFKRGRCIVKMLEDIRVPVPPVGTFVARSRWAVDAEIPIFTSDREYVDKFLVTEE